MDEKQADNPGPNRKEWREHLVSKLQDRYGLTREQARAKADAWLQRLDQDPNAQSSSLRAEVRDRRDPRPHLIMRSGKSRSGAPRLI